MSDNRCTYSYPECGRPATLAASRPSEHTANGIYWAARCDECSKQGGQDNRGLRGFVPYDPVKHANDWGRKACVMGLPQSAMQGSTLLLALQQPASDRPCGACGARLNLDGRRKAWFEVWRDKGNRLFVEEYHLRCDGEKPRTAWAGAPVISEDAIATLIGMER